MAEKKEKPKEQYLGIAQYAQYKGVHMSTVQDAVKNGRIPFENRNGRRMIPVGEADRIWDQIEQTGKSPYEEDGSPQISKVNAYMKGFKAKLMELEYKKKAGEVIDKCMVYSQIIATVRMSRDALRNVPQKIAPEIANEIDPHRCEIIMLREIDECLNELARMAENFK